MELKRRWIREPFCGISHFVGAALSVVALIVLLIRAQGRVWYVVSFAIYGASMIALYTASTLYHSLLVSERGAKLLRRFDYTAIFLLIIGTFTPVCLLKLRATLGWSLLGVEYALALVGIISLFVWKRAPHWIHVALYILMGWLAMFALPALRAALPTAPLAWLIGGGVVYSLGAVVYATDWPHLWPGKFSAHDLWHVFVLGGSACHFILMLYTV